jgi:uracil-DNA glycosylase
VVFKTEDGSPKFLFLSRKNFLDMPKGHIEKGENGYTAAIREAKEESAIEAKPFPFFREKMVYQFYKGKVKVKKFLTMFLGEVSPESKPKISKEHTGYMWLTYDEAIKKLKYAPQKKLINRCNEYIRRIREMEKINEGYSKLPHGVENWALSKRLVKGEGLLDAKIMLIGQAPGGNEDEIGRPFIGRSGRLLDELIESAGLRRENLYITSTVQFFPPENRIPTDEEIRMCRPLLQEQINLIKPKLIVLVGAVAAKEFLGNGAVMGIHGQSFKEKGQDYFVTLHPAAAVRIQKNLPVIRDDFKKLKAAVRAIIAS